MARHFSWLTVLLFSVGSIGCSICCGPDDYNYGTYGGIHPRADMQHGRVGSVFSDPSGSAMKLTPYGEVSEAGDITPQQNVPESAQPQNNGNDLPKPGTEQKNDGGSDAKGVDTQQYQPSRYRKQRRSPRNILRSSRTRSRGSNTASFLGGQRYRR